MLAMNESKSFSFGYTKENNTGFWKYGAKFPITIKCESWIRSYEERQEIVILDSDGSPDYGYEKVSQKKEAVTLTADEIPQKIQKLIPDAVVTYNN